MKIKKDHIFTVFIIAILISPYLLAFLNAPQLNFKLDRSWAWPLVAGLKQASLSALVSLLFGALLASSLFSCRTQKSYGRIKMILLAPNFIPPLFIILSVMSLSGALSISHQGLTWVVVTHSLMNGGLVAVALSSYFLQNVKKSWEVARVLGANPFDRLVRLWVPMMLPVLKQNFVLVFALCLVSFSIPLVIGGASVTSLEVHIFQ
ncbi:MAG: hypothetical protein GW917_01610, partial [Bdellovibrionales bacterium]|nr:hypothetical protein [Bdellovibrionales bacterium]